VLLAVLVITNLLLWSWRRGLIISLVLLCLAIPILYTSPAIQNGLARTQSDVTNYDDGNPDSSVGLRLEFHKYSKQLIANAPLFGYGTGSFHHEYHELTGLTGERDPVHPHNDFYWLWVEIGILGVFTLVAFISATCYYGLKFDSPWSKLAVAVILSYAIGALQGGFFTDNISGAALIIILSVLLAPSMSQLKYGRYSSN
jgi:O-antigen ligase